jgi:hypothetical protein
VLLLHEEEQLVHPVERRAVARLVVVQGLAEADEGQAAFVFDGVAHWWSLPVA